MNAGAIVSAIFRPDRSERYEREKRKTDFLVFLKAWKFEIAGGHDPAKIASRFPDKVRFFVHHKTAVEGVFQGATRSEFDSLATPVCDFTLSQLQETQNGEWTGREKLSKAIGEVILFLEKS